MHTMVQRNCRINLFPIGNEMVLFVYTFYFVYIQCIIQPDGEYPTDENWSTSMKRSPIPYVVAAIKIFFQERTKSFMKRTRQHTLTHPIYQHVKQTTSKTKNTFPYTAVLKLIYEHIINYVHSGLTLINGNILIQDSKVTTYNFVF